MILLLYYVDWPAAIAMIGITATICGYWLQNRREAREDAGLRKRVTELENASVGTQSLNERIGKLDQEVARLAREVSKKRDKVTR